MDSAALEVLLLLQSCSCLDAVLLAFDSARSNSTLSPHSLSGPGLATSSFGPACLETLLLTPDVVSLDPSLLPRSISWIGTFPIALECVQMASILFMQSMVKVGPTLLALDSASVDSFTFSKSFARFEFFAFVLGLACAEPVFSPSALEAAAVDVSLLIHSSTHPGPSPFTSDCHHLDLLLSIRSATRADLILSIFGLARISSVSPLFVLDVAPFALSLLAHSFACSGTFLFAPDFTYLDLPLLARRYGRLEAPPSVLLRSSLEILPSTLDCASPGLSTSLRQSARTSDVWQIYKSWLPCSVELLPCVVIRWGSPFSFVVHFDMRSGWKLCCCCRPDLHLTLWC